MSEEYFEVYKCKGCIMISYNCMVYTCITEMIEECPCHNCLVKVTCSYDDVCWPYEKFIDKVNSIDKFVERLEEYERIYNPETSV